MMPAEEGREVKRKGPCCVCKETKAARDECVMRLGEEGCAERIADHVECLKKNGFS